MRILFLLLLVYPYFISNISFSQDKYSNLPVRSLKISANDSVIFLPDRFLIEGSELVRSKSDSLISPNDYKLFYSKGVLKLNKKYDSLKISYRYLPLDLETSYRRNEIISISDSLLRKKNIITETSQIKSSNDIFGNSIKKSGSLIRSFSVGSNKDLSLNSGFQLQLNGNISDDISVTASLTDESTPLLPEGNTQTIKEIDKIFINITHRNFDVTLGDFVYETNSGFLGKISRKLQGGKASYKTQNFNLDVVYGSPPGKFITNEFLAVDGLQGPYRLNSESGSPNILVIPGSDKVYLNGALMKRGENEDYTIDYSVGEIVFTIKNLLKNNSRILVEFEYNDQQYERNFLSVSANSKIMDEKINSTILFLQEGDNNSSPIDFIMTDENKKIIEGAGDNQLNSSKSSIQYVGKDSVTLKGLGQYTKRDTIIENQSYSYFIYNPGTEDALYSVQFSFVGDGKGDYIRQSYGIFKWVGIGKGSYSAINLLPLPERKRYAVWNLSFNPNKDLKISNELAVSNYDRNTLSDLDGQGINGFGINTKIDYSVELKNIFDREMGSLKISASNYYLSDKFSSPTRTNEVDYFYTWNIRDSSESNKHIYSMMLDYAPTKKMDLKYEYAKNNYGISNHAARNYFEYFVNDSTYPALNVKLTNVKNQELSFNNDFNSIYANTNYNLDKYEVSVGFLNEDKKIIGSTSDSLIDGYRIMSLNSNLGFKFTKRSTLQYEIEYREDYIPSFLVLEKESYRLINKLNLNYLNNENLSALISGGFQKLEFTEKYMKNSTGNNLNIFAKSLLHYSNEKKSIESNYYYESSSQYSAKNQKIYLRVEKGKGTHIYLGDLNKNGVADENEFQQVKYDGDYIPLSVKTDELAPVTDLKTSFRIKITPVREIQRAETMIEKLLSNVSTETNYQINEMNKTDKNEDIYLLKLSKFLNDSNTIQGNQSFTQDLFLLEKIKFINIRFRYEARRSLAQYTYGIERRSSFERSMRLRFQFMNNITNETNLVNGNDNSFSMGAEDRNYLIKSRDISTTFSYRPVNELEMSFGLTTGKKDDALQSITAAYNTQSVAVNYSLLSRGNLTLSLERNEMILNKTTEYVPYNLTDGKIIGISWLLNSSFNYQLNSFTACSFSYFGRKPADKNIIHNMTLEVKLIF